MNNCSLPTELRQTLASQPLRTRDGDWCQNPSPIAFEQLVQELITQRIRPRAVVNHPYCQRLCNRCRQDLQRELMSHQLALQLAELPDVMPAVAVA